MNKDICIVNGYGAKVITLTAEVGKTQYRLFDQQRLGLPEGAMVVGFSIRYNGFFGLNVERSINGNLLVNTQVVQSSFLNLQGWGKINYLANVPLFNFTSFPNFSVAGPFSTFQNLIKPIPVERIAWSRSNIVLSQEAANSVVTANTDFEIIVLYQLQTAGNAYPQITQFYPSGQNFVAYKQSLLEIKLTAGKQFFPLAQDGKSSIDDDSIIYGVSYLPYSYQTQSGGIAPNQNAIGSTFLTLQCGRSNILEKFPFRLLFANPNLNLPYFPIEPVLAGGIDWQSSEFFVQDNATLAAGQSFVLMFHYQKPCEDEQYK